MLHVDSPIVFFKPLRAVAVLTAPCLWMVGCDLFGSSPFRNNEECPDHEHAQAKSAAKTSVQDEGNDHCPGDAGSGRLVLEFHHEVDGQDLMFNTIAYTNAAGNPYSVSRLEYFLSDFKFVDHDFTTVLHEVDTVLYINPRMDSTLVADLGEIPAGHYHALSFAFGLAPEKNVFPSTMVGRTPEKDGMAWVASLGGGYHFMKMEGNFTASNGDKGGYGTHLGSDVDQDNHFRTDPHDLQIHNNAVDAHDFVIPITMNLNKWYAEPHLMDFNTYDAGSIMGVNATQQLFKANGANVFSLDRDSIRVEPYSESLASH